MNRSDDFSQKEKSACDNQQVLVLENRISSQYNTNQISGELTNQQIKFQCPKHSTPMSTSFNAHHILISKQNQQDSSDLDKKRKFQQKLRNLNLQRYALRKSPFNESEKASKDVTNTEDQRPLSYLERNMDPELQTEDDFSPWRMSRMRASPMYPRHEHFKNAFPLRNNIKRSMKHRGSDHSKTMRDSKNAIKDLLTSNESMVVVSDNVRTKTNGNSQQSDECINSSRVNNTGMAASKDLENIYNIDESNRASK